MKDEDVFSALREVGCCSGCCMRFIGLRNPDTYARIDEVAAKYTSAKPGTTQTSEDRLLNGDNSGNDTQNNGQSTDDQRPSEQSANGQQSSNGQGTSNGRTDEGPSAKRRKLDVCVCCLGILQKEFWPECVEQVKIFLQKRGNYDCKTFACALSSPACIMLREKSLVYHLQSVYPEFMSQRIAPLKEAWKWSFGVVLEKAIDKTLDSGNVSPLLITINMEYADDLTELDTLKNMAPAYYESRARQSRRFPIDATRRCVEEVLAAHAKADAVRRWYGAPPPRAHAPARLVHVQCAHAPIYLAGRYVKLSRELSQTPWLIGGKRMMESSVQDLIFEPIAQFYGISPEDAEHRLKFISSGREDVDVRCLGDGRPFAVEVSDPRCTPDAGQLRELCGKMTVAGRLRVDLLQPVGKNHLVHLKKGEDSKTKAYRALCIKLPQGVNDEGTESASTPTEVTDEDIERIRAYRSCGEPGCACRVKLSQRTPLRVLHRRPLRTRQRKILSLDAEKVPGHPNLFTVSLETEAGTYVKEFVHGDLGRTQPCLRDVLRAQVDILALDVTAVHLEWPLPE